MNQHSKLPSQVSPSQPPWTRAQIEHTRQQLLSAQAQYDSIVQEIRRRLALGENIEIRPELSNENLTRLVEEIREIREVLAAETIRAGTS